MENHRFCSPSNWVSSMLSTNLSTAWPSVAWFNRGCLRSCPLSPSTAQLSCRRFGEREASRSPSCDVWTLPSFRCRLNLTKPSSRKIGRLESMNQRSVKTSEDCHATLPVDFGNLSLLIPIFFTSFLHRQFRVDANCWLACLRFAVLHGDIVPA